MRLLLAFLLCAVLSVALANDSQQQQQQQVSSKSRSRALSAQELSIEAASSRVIDYEMGEFADRCTAIGVAKLASVDGST